MVNSIRLKWVNLGPNIFTGSTEYSPQTTSMRTIVAFFWFCTLVITAAYTANLAAFLTLQQIDNRIKSVDHLARQTGTKYGVLNNSDLMHFFENSRLDIFLNHFFSALGAVWSETFVYVHIFMSYNTWFWCFEI